VLSSWWWLRFKTWDYVAASPKKKIKKKKTRFCHGN